MKNFQHEHILSLLGVCLDNDPQFIIMELMEGGELFDQILQREQFNESEARQAIRCIIDAIRYCHNLNIVHRDIKPENLRLKSKKHELESLKISDFNCSL